MPSRVAVIQMQSSDQPVANQQRVSALVAQAAEAGAKLIVLPEMWLYIGSANDLQRVVSPAVQARALEFLTQLARTHQVWIVGGSLPWSASHGTDAPASAMQKPYARCWVVDDKGVPVAHYDKMHLFDVEVADGVGSYRESAHYSAGSEPVLLTTPFGVLGLAICYDLRFPELFRKLWQAGADIIALPSAFTEVTGRAHWSSLLRARAIENSCYLLAPNQTGLHSDGRSTWGHSMIVGPWGEELGSLASGEGVVLADIDLANTASIRARMPCHLHQKIVL